MQSFETSDVQFNLPLTITSEHVAAGLLWLDSMSSAKKWGLSLANICRLLGDLPANNYLDLKSEADIYQSIEMSDDRIRRISLLLGIASALDLIAPSTAVSYQWFNTPGANALLNNLSIKDYLLEHNNLCAFIAIRRYLDAAALG